MSFRMPPLVRKIVLVLHAISGIGWMGVDVALLILLVRGRTTASAEEAVGSYLSVGSVVQGAVPVLSVGVLLTGLLLGAGTAWGLSRYWWVFIKLILSVVMVALVFALLLPAVWALPPLTGSLSADEVRYRLGPTGTMLFFPPAVSFTLLAVATVLSIFKPRALTPWTAGP